MVIINHDCIDGFVYATKFLISEAAPSSRGVWLIESSPDINFLPRNNLKTQKGGKTQND